MQRKAIFHAIYAAIKKLFSNPHVRRFLRKVLAEAVEINQDHPRVAPKVTVESNQSMKPTASLRGNPGVFATTPWLGLSLSR
jgi:hypothetical protein